MDTGLVLPLSAALEGRSIAAWRALRRARFPKLRRPAPVGIVHNGGTRRVYGCALCGATVSMCALWPVTARVRDFEALHCSTAHIRGWLLRRLSDDDRADLATALAAAEPLNAVALQAAAAVATSTAPRCHGCDDLLPCGCGAEIRGSFQQL